MTQPATTSRVTPRAAAQSRRPLASRLAAAETAIILVAALVLSLLIKTFLIQAFFIPSAVDGATPSIEDDRIIVSQLSSRTPFDLHRGDVVVFKDPGGWLRPTSPPERGRRPRRDRLR